MDASTREVRWRRSNLSAVGVSLVCHQLVGPWLRTRILKLERSFGRLVLAELLEVVDQRFSASDADVVLLFRLFSTAVTIAVRGRGRGQGVFVRAPHAVDVQHLARP